MIAPSGIWSLDGAQRPDLGHRLGIFPGELRDRPLQRANTTRQALDRLGDRVWQMDPIGVGTLRTAPIHTYRMTGVTHDRRVRRHIGDDHAVGADLGAMADRDRAEQLGAGADRDVVLDCRMALAGGKARATERDTLVERHVIADLSGLADHNAGAVIDEQALADARGWMNLDPGHGSGHQRDRAWQQRDFRCV